MNACAVQLVASLLLYLLHGPESPPLPCAPLLPQRFCSEELGQYWDGRRALVDQHYRGLEPHPTEFRVVERVEMEMTQTLSFDQMVRVFGR